MPETSLASRFARLSPLARRSTLAALVLLLLAMIALAAMHFAAATLRSRILAALGPDAQVEAINVGWTSVEIVNLRIPAPQGWPATDALRAERVMVEPDLRSLLSDTARIRHVRMTNAYLSALRGRDGKMHVLPSLTERSANSAGIVQTAQTSTTAGSGTAVLIHSIETTGGTVEFFDSSVRSPPNKIVLNQLQVRVDDIHLPGMQGHSKLEIDGKVQGASASAREGSLHLAGWVEGASDDLDITMRLAGVDMVVLQPYLLRATEAGVQRGQLDLQLHSTVKARQLYAPGTVTITHLELASGNGLGTFMGVPRRAVLSSLENRQGVISVQFTLQGNLDDPRFSINENFTMRLGAAVAQGLGISLEGLARGVGSVGQKSMETASDAVKHLFGK